MLTHAECLMPKALGEFGKARSSDVAHTILGMIQSAPGLITLEEIWTGVSQDVDSNTQLTEIMQKLLSAGKIQMTSVIEGGKKRHGFLPIRRSIIEKSDFIDFGLLTEEEREMKI
jgi:hypothetical protein